MNKNGIFLAIMAFIFTFATISYFMSPGRQSSEIVLKLKNPTKIEIEEGVAYTLDNDSGAEKDLTFRCNPKTGVGYFSLKSKNLSWASTHCQDMVGAVTEIEEGKKEFAVLKVKEVQHKIFYKVERNQAL